MSKRLTDNQKKEIINEFTNGKSIDELADKFGYTKLTIIRNLKKDVGEDKYNILKTNLIKVIYLFLRNPRKIT